MPTHGTTDRMPSPRWVVLVGIAGTMAGLPYLDAIAAFMVALMIAQIAWELGWAAVKELVDTGLESHRVDAVRETIRSVGGVRDIHMASHPAPWGPRRRPTFMCSWIRQSASRRATSSVCRWKSESSAKSMRSQT